MAVKPIPEGYHSYTPYFVVEGAAEFIDFLKGAFEAEELFRMAMPGTNKVGHAEIRIGDSIVMCGDANPEHPARQLNGMLYVRDVDATYERAVKLGAKSERPPADQFYGDRMSGVIDRWGNYWGVATHIEDVSPEEMERRIAKMKG